MKTLLFALVLLPSLVFSQDIKTYSLNDAMVYSQWSSNLRGKMELESGVQLPLASRGPWSSTVQLGYVMDANNFAVGNAWVGSTALYYNVTNDLSAYTQFKTDFLGHHSQETGVSRVFMRTQHATVNASLGWVYSHPFRTSAQPRWAFSVMASFPVSRL